MHRQSRQLGAKPADVLACKAKAREMPDRVTELKGVVAPVQSSWQRWRMDWLPDDKSISMISSCER